MNLVSRSQVSRGESLMNGTLTIHSVKRNDGGIYICKAENTLGPATDTARLVIFLVLQFKVRPSQEVNLASLQLVPLGRYSKKKISDYNQ